MIGVFYIWTQWIIVISIPALGSGVISNEPRGRENSTPILLNPLYSVLSFTQSNQVFYGVALPELSFKTPHASPQGVFFTVFSHSPEILPLDRLYLTLLHFLQRLLQEFPQRSHTSIKVEQLFPLLIHLDIPRWLSPVFPYP